MNTAGWGPCPGIDKVEGAPLAIQTPYLTLATESSLLQAGPDALDPPSMLWMAVGVPTGALMLQHQCVIHKAYRGAELKSEESSGLSHPMPEGGPGTAAEFPGGNRAELVLGLSTSQPLSKLALEDLDKSTVRDRPSIGQHCSSGRLVTP